MRAVVRWCIVDAYRAGGKDEEGSQGFNGVEARGQIDRPGYQVHHRRANESKGIRDSLVEMPLYEGRKEGGGDMMSLCQSICLYGRTKGPSNNTRDR